MPIDTPVKICNIALGHLGEAPIIDLTGNSTAAQACNLHYEMTRDELLRSHPWNFAKTRTVLSQNSTDPTFGWEKQYNLPSDCIRVVEVNDSEFGDELTDKFIIEGGVLLTDADAVNLVYIQQITAVDQFDSLFVKAFAMRLAIALSETIRGTTQKTAELVEAYERVVAPLARRVDSNEQRRSKGLLDVSSPMLASRGGVSSLLTLTSSVGTSSTGTGLSWSPVIPISSGSSGTAGQIAYQGDYIYLYNGAQWLRFTGDTF